MFTEMYRLFISDADIARLLKYVNALCMYIGIRIQYVQWKHKVSEQVRMVLN